MKRNSKDRATSAPRIYPTPPINPPYDAVARRARELWQARGCPQGCDEAIWFEAERAIAIEMSKGMPPLEERGVEMPADAQVLGARVDETIAHHPPPGRRASPTSI